MEKATSVNSIAEEKFVEIFCDTFGPDKANNLYVLQHPVLFLHFLKQKDLQIVAGLWI